MDISKSEYQKIMDNYLLETSLDFANKGGDPKEYLYFLLDNVDTTKTMRQAVNNVLPRFKDM